MFVQFGDQTPLNLAEAVELQAFWRHTSRRLKSTLIRGHARQTWPSPNAEQFGYEHGKGVTIARKIGYPALVRPTFVLEYNEEIFGVTWRVQSVTQIVGADRSFPPVPLVDVDCISDGETTVIGASWNIGKQVFAATAKRDSHVLVIAESSR